MVDKNYCMSSYLAFRYIVDDDKDFYDNTKHRVYQLISENNRVLVGDEYDIDKAIEIEIEKLRKKKLGILLSGGMDSACLAAYMQGCDAYTFRFLGGEYKKKELARAEAYAAYYGLNLHYVDIDWNIIKSNLDDVILHKGAPVHSIEPQIYVAAKQAKADGMEVMIIGDAADYVFGGMDGLYSKDWEFAEFIERYIYIDPNQVLNNPVNMNYAFEKYRRGSKIDFEALMHEYTDIESYSSYENAFSTAGISYFDPYEKLKMSNKLDLDRIRNGDSKYLVRNLFRLKYPNFEVPKKLPMPRPVDEYFSSWKGPLRREFVNDLDMKMFSGNQKWLLYCLEYFLNIYE